MKNHRIISALTICVTLFLMFLGPWVRAADAGLACPDWPQCFNSWLPQQLNNYRVFLEWFHRFMAFITSSLFLWLMISILLYSKHRRQKVLVILAAFFLLVQIILGGLTVLLKLHATIVNLHLLTALIFLSLLFIIWRYEQKPTQLIAKNSSLTFMRNYSLILFAILFIQIITGGRMSSNHAGLACDSFPACYYEIISDKTNPQQVIKKPVYIPDLSIRRQEIHFSHRWLGIITFLLLLATLLTCNYNRKVRKQLAQSHIIPKLGLLTTLVAFQILLGAINVWWRLPIAITVMHSFVAYLIHLSALSLCISQLPSRKPTKHLV